MEEQVGLTGAQETLLPVLQARAIDSRRSTPVLGDALSAELLDRIDYDFSRTRLSIGNHVLVVLRSKHLDEWALRFLTEHPDATVVHLACGLDTRAFRLPPPPQTRWYDIDVPDVIELRERLFPARENHRTIAASVTEPDWLEQVPADRPTLIIAEGLTPYLATGDGIDLLRRLVERFPSGEMAFDAVLPWLVRASRFSPLLRTTGARFGWNIDDPHEPVRQVPGLRLVEEKSLVDSPHAARLPAPHRFSARLMSTARPLRMALRLLDYRFGPS